MNRIRRKLNIWIARRKYRKMFRRTKSLQRRLDMMEKVLDFADDQLDKKLEKAANKKK